MADTTQETESKVHRVKDLRDNIMARITALADIATQQEKDAVDQLLARAKEGQHSTTMVTLTPAACALLFYVCNGYNREWLPARVVEYERRMNNGAWRWNGQGISFYVNGNLADGQHRLCAAALSKFTMETSVVFGVQPESVTTIDNGAARAGHVHAAMDGIVDSKRKEAILRTTASYFSKLRPDPIPFEQLKSAAELLAAMKKHNTTLDRAIKLGDESLSTVAKGYLSKLEAARIAFIMLCGGWASDKIAHTLSRVQEGRSNEEEGKESSPLFVVSKMIADKAKADNIVAIKQIGLVVGAATYFENGEVVTARSLKQQVDKQLPSPIYTPRQQAAAA